MTPPTDSALRAALRAGYGFAIDDLEVETDGADSLAWTWRATTTSGRNLFVKLRREVRPAAILVPRHLATIGLDEVVAALPTLEGAAWLDVDGWTAVVMDLVEGETGFRAGLSLEQWRRLGGFSERLHSVALPGELRALVRVEDFRSAWTDRALALDERIAALDEASLDELAVEVRRRWIAERGTIRRLVSAVEALGARIRARPAAPANVLCHADFHAANVLVDRHGGIHVVDWDELVLAPRERDWMFVRGSVVAGTVTDQEADAFEAGYGPAAAAPDPELLAWYRIDWAVQDVTGFAEEVLFEPDRDPPTRPRAARIFDALFGPTDEVAGALALAVRVRA